MKIGNIMNIASAAARPYGNGSTICSPMLTASDANKNIR
jgi:hypothetical protein